MSNYIHTKALVLVCFSVVAVAYSGVAADDSVGPVAERLSDKAYPDITLHRIAFGSCNKPKKDQRFWDVIRTQEPDMMLLLGDTIYANSSEPVRQKKAYDEVSIIPEYRTFREEIPTHATWDNHDYAKDYPGKLNIHAEECEQFFLDHFSIQKNDKRRSRSGVYGSWVYGEKPHRVQVVMLDLQRFRDPLKEGARDERFTPQKGKTLMGTEQWKWFEEQLKEEAEGRS